MDIVKCLMVGKVVLFAFALYYSFVFMFSMFGVLVKSIFDIVAHKKYCYTVNKSVYVPVVLWVLFYMCHSAIFLIKG